MGTIWVEG
jgi:hypothetical protein